jgi:antitoxin component YwqK of YwqJK toxin-antitoxin module
MVGIVTVAVLALTAAWFILRKPASVPSAETPAATLPELPRSSMVLSNGRLWEHGRDVPFTGFMVEHYADGTLRSRSAVSNGVLHGLSLGWFTNGQLQISEEFHEGVSHGVRTRWYADGAPQSEAHIVAGKLHGTFRRWHPDGHLAEQSEFVEGQPDGISFAFHPGGSLKARVRMESGRVIEQQFWKEGEMAGTLVETSASPRPQPSVTAKPRS